MAQFNSGKDLFNEGRFFEAHEVWEDLWRESIGTERSFVQALVQVAAALHHASRGNRTGAISLLSKALIRLAYCPDQFFGADMKTFRTAVEQARKQLTEGADLSPFELRKYD